MKLTDEILAARAKWRYRGNGRPPFAQSPTAGQESVWDYPRPPKLAADRRTVTVALGEVLVARSSRAIRVLETASPPTFYLPPTDISPAAKARLRPTSRRSLCEWKGWAVEVDFADIPGAGWFYAATFPEFSAIAGYFSFYPRKLQCTVAGEPVRAQPGGYYGGWITSEIVGPFKGEPGTEDW